MNVRYQRSRELMEAPFGDELIALDREGGRCLAFNDVATQIWKMIASPTSVDDLVSALMDSYQVDRATCSDDVAEWLLQMERGNLVVRVGNGGQCR